MKKLGLFVLAAAVCLPLTAFANDFMGAPAASIKEGQFDIGLNYTWTNMDLESSGVKIKEFLNGASESAPERNFGAVRDVKMNKVFASFGASIVENWDVYVLVGGADLQTRHLDRSLPGHTNNVAADPTFACGIGTKVTFWQEGDLSLGGLAQITTAQGFDAKSKGRYLNRDGTPSAFTYKSTYTLDITEVQLAVGPTYRLAPGWTVYGGPFAHFVTGNFSDRSNQLNNGSLDGLTIKESGDLEQRAWFGGYLGTQYEIVESLTAALEYQHTAWSDAIGANIAYRF